MRARCTERLVVAVAVMAVLGGCASKVDGSGGAQPPAQTIQVAVSPASAELVEGQGMQFDAVVTGTSDTAVTWEVEEAGGGTIDPTTGAYVAPGAVGTFHVRAVSRADPSASGVAVVTVTTPPPGSVTISPRTTSVLAGGSVTFTARLNGVAGGVTFGIQEASGCGSVTPDGVYTAPATARTCHVVAMSTADSTRTDVATVTVTTAAPVVVTLDRSTASVDACRTVTFTASVTGASDTSVTWSVVEGAGGGSVSKGVYTAPTSAGTYHVVATSVANPGSRAQATITVSERVLSVAVTPNTAAVGPGATQQFSAVITTTCGAIEAT